MFAPQKELSRTPKRNLESAFEEAENNDQDQLNSSKKMNTTQQLSKFSNLKILNN